MALQCRCLATITAAIITGKSGHAVACVWQTALIFNNWTLVATAVIYMNMGCFFSIDVCRTPHLKEGRLRPSRDTIGSAVQFEVHVTLCRGFVKQTNRSRVCCHLAAAEATQSVSETGLQDLWGHLLYYATHPMQFKLSSRKRLHLIINTTSAESLHWWRFKRLCSEAQEQKQSTRIELWMSDIPHPQ